MATAPGPRGTLIPNSPKPSPKTAARSNHEERSSYLADDGRVYPDRASAAMASIIHLSIISKKERGAYGIGPAAVALKIEHRGKIMEILSEVDEPEAKTL